VTMTNLIQLAMPRRVIRLNRSKYYLRPALERYGINLKFDGKIAVFTTEKFPIFPARISSLELY